MQAAMLSVAVVVAVPFTAQSAAVSVQGNCVTASSCSSPTTISYDQTITGTVPYSLTFADGDKYGITVAYSATYGAAGSQIVVDPTITYIGSAPSVATDVISLNFYQSIFDNSPGTFDGTYSETIPIVVPANVEVFGQLFVDGQGLPLLGPFTNGTYDPNAMQALTGLNGNTLAYEYNFTYQFSAGVLNGTSTSSPSAMLTPEPAQTIPAALALGGFALAAFRRRRG
jgi:MYXO-CTERM domain-containing protein